jgi:H+-transporting ATPase
MEPDEKDLGEYPALDRYISTYRDPRDQAADEADKKHNKVRWWEFWKTGIENPQQPEKKPGAPDAWLETDLHEGLRSTDVEERRKVSGWNELVAESENMFAKFLGFFTGPILYGECSAYPFPRLAQHAETQANKTQCPKSWR